MSVRIRLAAPDKLPEAQPDEHLATNEADAGSSPAGKASSSGCRGACPSPPALEAGDRWLESTRPDQSSPPARIYARAEDIGSFALKTQMPISPLAGQPCVETTLQAADTSPAKREVAGSNPAAPTNRRVAQRIERLRSAAEHLLGSTQGIAVPRPTLQGADTSGLVGSNPTSGLDRRKSAADVSLGLGTAFRARREDEDSSDERRIPCA